MVEFSSGCSLPVPAGAVQCGCKIEESHGSSRPPHPVRSSGPLGHVDHTCDLPSCRPRTATSPFLLQRHGSRSESQWNVPIISTNHKSLKTLEEVDVSRSLEKPRVRGQSNTVRIHIFIYHALNKLILSSYNCPPVSFLHVGYPR